MIPQKSKKEIYNKTLDLFRMFYLRGTYAVTQEIEEPISNEILRKKRLLSLAPNLETISNKKTKIVAMKIRTTMKEAILNSNLFENTDQMFEKLERVAKKVYTKPKVYNALSGGEVGCLSCRNRILKGAYLDIFKEFLKKE